MKNDWYKNDIPQDSQYEDQHSCSHCGIPLKKYKKPSIQFINGREIKKRPLCVLCEKRDRDLLLATNDCIRLYGSMISLYEVFDLYEDTKRAKKMHFDPFAKVRDVYQGREKLTIEDIEGWVEEGIIELSKDKKLTARASEAREKIEQEIEKQDIPEEDKIETPNKVKENFDPNTLSRLREEGGASVGKHRWSLRKNT